MTIPETLTQLRRYLSQIGPGETVDEDTIAKFASDIENEYTRETLKQKISKTFSNVGKMKIYIAGPMRGLAGFNYNRFYDMSRILSEEGCGVVNPAMIGETFGTPKQINEDPALLEKVQQAELDELRSCDAILMLSGWERSEGAKRELVEAIKNGLSVYLEQ